MQIIVQIKNVYGNESVYPVCDKAKAFAVIANQKTMTRQTLEQVQRLGFAIMVADRFGVATCELKVA